MKWLIASDLHGSSACCQKLFHRFEEEKAERILLLGDLLYHGARNALPQDYETITTAELLNEYKDVITCVRGNCDSEVDQMVLAFPIMQDFTALVESGCLIMATHGHLYDEHSRLPLIGVDVLLSGHTHVPVCHDFGNFVAMNPGSVSIPKGGSRHSYMTLENGLYIWKDLEGEAYKRFEMTPRHG